MRARELASFLGRVRQLTTRQRRELIEALHGVYDQTGAVNRVLDARIAGSPSCPYCAEKGIQRWGSARGLQRFRCTGCRRTFNTLTGTPLAHLKRRDAWPEYVGALEDGLSIRKAARRCGVHDTTTFRWRHRWLALPCDRKDDKLTGIVEADETYFLESLKGSRAWKRVAIGDLRPWRLPRRRGGRAKKRGLSREQIPILIARDRNGATTDAVLPRFDRHSVGAVLGAALDRSDAVLCTDSARPYASFAKETGITHRRINLAAGRCVVQGVLHIQHVNAYHSRLKEWMRRFRGVSTKYLANYLGWRRLLEREVDTLTPELWLRLAVG